MIKEILPAFLLSRRDFEGCPIPTWPALGDGTSTTAELVPPSSYGVTTMRGAMPCALWWSTDGVWGMSEESAPLPPVGVVRDTFY